MNAEPKTQIANVSYNSRFEDLQGGGRLFAGLDVRAEIHHDGVPMEYFRFRYPSAPTKSIDSIVKSVGDAIIRGDFKNLPEGVTELKFGDL